MKDVRLPGESAPSAVEETTDVFFKLERRQNSSSIRLGLDRKFKKSQKKSGMIFTPESAHIKFALVVSRMRSSMVDASECSTMTEHVFKFRCHSRKAFMMNGRAVQQESLFLSAMIPGSRLIPTHKGVHK